MFTSHAGFSSLKCAVALIVQVLWFVGLFYGLVILAQMSSAFRRQHKIVNVKIDKPQQASCQR